MAAPEFTIDLLLDGLSYSAARGDLGGRQVAVSYVPKVHSERLNAVGDATLDPVEYTTFHRGSGASRNIGVSGMTAYGENVWPCDPGLLLPGPEVTLVALSGANAVVRPDGIAEADGHIFVAAGRYVFQLTAGQGTVPPPSQSLDLGPSAVGRSLLRFGASLFLSSANVGSGVGLNLYERPDGGAWTNAMPGATAVAPNGALGRVWWTISGLTTERLVAQFADRGIRYTATGPRLDTNWTPGLANAPIDIGGTGVITRFVATMTHLYIASTRGLHDLDQSGLAPNLVPQAETMATAGGGGGLATLAADGYLYYSVGYQLFRVTAVGTQYAQVEDVTPMVALPNETPAAGYGTALVKNGEWLIYSMYDPINDTSWVAWGREARQGEVGPIVWHVAPIVLHGWKVTALHLSGLDTGGPRLWLFGTTLAGAISARWAPLALTTPYADLKSGRGRRFSQAGFLVLPAEDGGDDAIPKDIEEIVSENENVSVGNSITVSARKESESAFSQLAAFTSGPRALAQVRAAFVSQRPTFRLDLVGTPLSPPVSRRVSIRWLPNPDLREVRRYVLKLGRYEMYGNVGYSLVGAEQQLARLVTLATSASRVNMTDEANTALIVRVLKIEGPAEFQATDSNDRVLVVGLTISVFGSQPKPTFVWDSGTTYDEEHSWA